MTLISDKNSECGVCGEISTQPDLFSTNTMGSNDLDGRPSEMMRSTMSAWIERCPGCGYCATDLGEFRRGLNGIILSPEYRDILERDDIPELAISFLAISYIAELNEEYAYAAETAKYAAWVLDDTNAIGESRNARLRAISMLDLAGENRPPSGESGEGSTLVTIDLMRRTKLFNQAENLIERTAVESFDDDTLQLMQCQRMFVANKDSSAYTEEEAIEFSLGC